MEGDKIATKSVLVALVIGIAVWATMGPPAPRYNSLAHVAYHP
jgi:hypothetical protein